MIFIYIRFSYEYECPGNLTNYGYLTNVVMVRIQRLPLFTLARIFILITRYWLVLGMDLSMISQSN